MQKPLQSLWSVACFVCLYMGRHLLMANMNGFGIITTSTEHVRSEAKTGTWYGDCDNIRHDSRHGRHNFNESNFSARDFYSK